MTPDPTGQVHHLHWRDLAQLVRDTVGQVDALIVDAPYDAVTHSGHDASVGVDSDGADRRAICYAPWDAATVSDFVQTWSPLVSGWMLSITSDSLGQSWRSAYAESGRQAFAAVPCIESGATDRKLQDGPASWTTHLMVGRPRGSAWIGWGQSRSYYLGPREAKPVIGGKPVWLMRQLMEDYTRPGDLVCDPCCGAGTTLLAAKLLGRRWIGGDLDETHAELARERLRDLPTADKRGTLAINWGER